MLRRRFFQLLAALAAVPRALRPAAVLTNRFVAATQFSRVPSGGKDLRETVDEIMAHGFNGLEYPIDLPEQDARLVLEYAQSRGMVITAQAGAMELFGRDEPPAISPFSPEYAGAARKKVEELLGKLGGVERIYNAFCYQDEPFHSGPKSFDHSDAARAQFKRRYDYDLPADVESVRDDPKRWLDVLNFQSDRFPAAWRQVYRIIKEVDPRFKVVLTHDSHSTFGAGVGSNAKLAMDDVFHWGGDFADMFVFDVYPYMMFDFRYGECGRVRHPRMSQAHYAFGQMRNLTRAYGKNLGFWVGTFNRAWFRRYMGPERQAQFWSEREMSYTAVAQGADFLLTGLNIPEDQRHWDNFGEGLRLLQSAGDALATAPKVKAKACFLFPRTQYLQLQEEYWNVGLAHELFLRAFGELDVLHEEQVRDGQLEGYRILVVCDVKLLPRAAAEHIAAFVRSGGIVIADCVPRFDEYKQPMDTMETLFGVVGAGTDRVRRTGVWEPRLTDARWFIPTDSTEAESHPPAAAVKGSAFGREVVFRMVSPRPGRVTSADVLLTNSDGQPALLRRREGKGQVFFFAFCLQDSYFQTYKEPDEISRMQLAELLHAACEAVNVRAHVRSSNPDIEASLRANQHEAFLFAINHEAANPHTLIDVRDLPFAIARVTDVAVGKGVPFTKSADGITLSLAASQEAPRLLRLS